MTEEQKFVAQVFESSKQACTDIMDITAEELIGELKKCPVDLAPAMIESLDYTLKSFVDKVKQRCAMLKVMATTETDYEFYKTMFDGLGYTNMNKEKKDG